MSNQIITLADTAAMTAILDSGDRAGAYLYYYNLIRDVDRAAADQILMQMQITTYSGFFGGAALIGNSIAKDSNPDLYPPTLDIFSEEILRGLILTIEAAVEDPDHSGVLSASEIRDADRSVWEAMQMEQYFPGNIQFPYSDSVFYSEGTMTAMLAGLQLTFGSRVGNRAEHFTGSGYVVDDATDYLLIRNADGIIVYVEDKLGLVDDATNGMHENPGQVVLTAGMDALASIARIALAFPKLALGVSAGLLSAFIGAVSVIQSNDAAAQAAGVGIGKLLSSVTDEIEYDATAAALFKKYVGADGVSADPNATLPEQFVWDDFGIILRSQGSFIADDDPDIIIGFNDSVNHAGSGEDILVGFGQSSNHGGAGSDWLFAKDAPALAA
ncbi:hypothetical protein [Saliniramus fredricksonii]|uniref:Uncharacterized protein n=1 Tax=Saliniramus fredricksonii TaxID=1653334 RepID=A0ABY0KA90_9HYPH|nr:hypothetical protein [Saliniramus fredricksonii]SCC81400.1 hypothetical protein GA0071312_2338 [Saliniramus fredricksonii]